MARLWLNSATGLRIQGIFVCILQACATAVLPALVFDWVYIGHTTWSIEVYVHWGVSTLAALVGMVGLATQASGWLALHVALGGAAGAALAAHDTSDYAMLDLRCSMQQAAFAGCGGCMCAATDSCTQAQLDAAGSCSGCAAPSTDFCSAMVTNRVIIAITGAATLVTMALPVLFSLLLLVRQESLAGTRREALQDARGAVSAQCYLLDDGHPLGMPLDALAAAIRTLQDSGDAQCLALAHRAIEALQRSAGMTQPASADGARTPRKGKLAGTSLYDLPKPPPPAQQQQPPQAEALAPPGRVLSLGALSAAGRRPSSLLSGGSGGFSPASTNPLLRFSGDHNGRVRPLPQPEPQPQPPIMESGVVLGSGEPEPYHESTESAQPGLRTSDPGAEDARAYVTEQPQAKKTPKKVEKAGSRELAQMYGISLEDTLAALKKKGPYRAKRGGADLQDEADNV